MPKKLPAPLQKLHAQTNRFPGNMQVCVAGEIFNTKRQKKVHARRTCTAKIYMPTVKLTCPGHSGSVMFLPWIDLRNKTTSEFRTVFHSRMSPLGVPNSQVLLYFMCRSCLPSKVTTFSFNVCSYESFYITTYSCLRKSGECVKKIV